MKKYPAVNEAMFRDLFQAELQWLLALSLGEKQLLGNGWTPACGQPFPHHQFALSGEIALVLLRIKPVCTATHGRWTALGARFYRDLLQPWCERYRLDEHGFAWELFPRSVFVGLKDCTSAMFRDTHNKHAALVQAVFHRTERGALQEELRLCYGIPSSVEGEEASGYTRCSKIYYQFQDPASLFAVSPDEICSPCLEYDATARDATAVGLHFHTCRQALLTYGISIALDIDQQEKWSNDAIAATWWAAANRDLPCWIELIQRDVLWNRLPLETGRYEIIRHLMKHQQPQG